MAKEVGTVHDEQTGETWTLSAAEEWALDKTLKDVYGVSKEMRDLIKEEKKFGADLLDAVNNHDGTIKAEGSKAMKSADAGRKASESFRDAVARSISQNTTVIGNVASGFQALKSLQQSAAEAEQRQTDDLIASNRDIADKLGAWRSMLAKFADFGRGIGGIGASIATVIGKGFMGAFGGIMQGIGYAFGWIVDTAAMLVRNFVNLASAILSLTAAVGGFLLRRIQTWGKTWRELNDQGIRFASIMSDGTTGMSGLAEQSARFNLQASEFGALISAGLRPAIMLGTEALGSLSHGVRRNLRDFGQLGLTIGEINGFVGDYLEGMRITGVLSNMSERERTARTTEYLKALTQLTQVTGASRDQIAANMRQNKEQAMLSGYLFNLEADQRKKVEKSHQYVNEVFSSFAGGEAVMESLMHGIVRGTVATSQFAQDLQRVGRSQEVAMLQQLADDTRAGKLTREEAQRRSFAIIGSLQEHLAKGNNVMESHVRIGTEIGDRMMQFAWSIEGARLTLEKNFRPENMTQLYANFGDIANQFRTMFDSVTTKLLQNDTIAGMMERIFKTIESALSAVGDAIKGESFQKFADGFAALGTRFLKIFGFVGDGISGVGGMAVKALEWLGDKFLAFGNWIADLVEKFRDTAGNWKQILFGRGMVSSDKDGTRREFDGLLVPLIDGIALAFKSLGERIWDYMKPHLVEWTAWLVFGIGAFKALKAYGAMLVADRAASAASFASRTATTAATGISPEWFSKQRGRVAAGGLGTGRAAKTVAGAGAIGKAAGGAGLGAGLKGLAAGMAAFANPATVIGAGAFAIVIAAISGAVAGSAWMLGKALPVFASGIASFAEIDGQALGAAAWGMTQLAGGLAAFGVGSAVGGLGSVIGSIGSAIASFFGGGPIKTIKEFAELNIDNAALAANVKSMIDLSDGIRSMAGLGMADFDLPRGLPRWMRSMSGIDFEGLASGMASVAGVSGFSDAVASLSAIQPDAIRDTADELQRLTDIIAEFTEAATGMPDGIDVGGNMNGAAGAGAAASSADILGALMDIGRRLRTANDHLADIRRNSGNEAKS